MVDIIMKSKTPDIKIEYFGQQSRFYDFFESIISDLMSDGGIYAETNSGSNINAYMFAKKGYKVITNDISEYSYSVAKAILSDSVPLKSDVKYKWLNEYANNYIKRAAVFAALIETSGYNAKIPLKPNKTLLTKIDKYIKLFSDAHNNNIRAYKSYNSDLYDFLNNIKAQRINVDVMFMDFAWPWRDGNKTEEYDTTANSLVNIFEQTKSDDIEIWDHKNVVDNVIKALNKAKKISKYVLLSNQSSNYPTPEILEVALLRNGFIYEERHTMLTDAEYEDNLGKNSFFREYLYVIKGDLHEEN